MAGTKERILALELSLDRWRRRASRWMRAGTRPWWLFFCLQTSPHKYGAHDRSWMITIPRSFSLGVAPTVVLLTVTVMLMLGCLTALSSRVMAMISLVLSGAMTILLSASHVTALSTLVWSLVCNRPGLESQTCSVSSSTKQVVCPSTSSGVASGKSFWLMTNSRLPRTEPCGTPYGPVVRGWLLRDSIWTR